MPKKTRKVTLPNGEIVTVDDAVGRVEIVDGQAHVCELGLAVRMGLNAHDITPEAALMYPVLELGPGEERPEHGEIFEGLPVFCWISQLDAARVMRVSDRQVRSREQAGLPYRGKGASKRYALPHSLIWATEYTGEIKRNKRCRYLPFSLALARYRVSLLEAAR